MLGVARIHTVHHLVTLSFHTRLFITVARCENFWNGTCGDEMRIHQSNCSELREVGIQKDDINLTHCGRVTQICVFNTVKLGTSASSP